MTTSSDSPQGVKATEMQFCEWVGLNGPKPTNDELAAYLTRELENRENVDQIERFLILCACASAMVLAISTSLWTALLPMGKTLAIGTLLSAPNPHHRQRESGAGERLIVR